MGFFDKLPTEDEELLPPGPAPKTRYTVVKGFNFGATEEERRKNRVEPGPLTISLPPATLKTCLRRGAIVEGK